ncbi:hypothetical protein PACTADRAFT_48117 [Pachysolen tannophilus NRRL Y-2460]|uniref:MATE efflux family protein n=1 Tax=Pachysolen tannophilus NRRL Y-2460 TaxID=669874 RepID=A0A1E4U2X2_PACTA|nr:hypothetical protein PACTADRAFT_48117 [Pachysolen tannophilus NRRL Y-2460]
MNRPLNANDSSVQNSKHQFHVTNSERRASVIIGSAGRAGLFIPSEFIDRGSALLDDELSSDEEQESDTQSQSQSQEEEVISSGGNNSDTWSGTSINPSILREEQRLLDENNIPIKNKTTDSLRYGSINSDLDNSIAVVETWEEAVEAGKVVKISKTAETKALTLSSIPLMVTFVLQNSLSVASVFSVGHLGSTELAAVTIGAMTANISAYSLIQGLATCLDTLCSQAYGAKKYHLVGMYFQKCTALIFTIFLPIWLFYIFFGDWLLGKMIPDPLSVKLAANYLRVISLGIPGYILFETGKRFLQSQGIFHASTYVLCICAPLNALMNYLFVWNKHIGIGYIGAPLAVAINYWLMAILLFLYTITTKSVKNPRKCWKGFQFYKSFRGWSKLSKLALPGVIMIEAEFLAFELLTLFASHLGTNTLAAQSVVTTMASLTYQVPFAISIASATRIANFLGASLPALAENCAKVGLVFGLAVSVLNFSFLFFFQKSIAHGFTSDENVVVIVAKILPLVAFIQIFDALNAVSAGCLRGQGLQKIGGTVNLISYYIIGLPVSYILTFHYGLGLYGLWLGTGLALFIIGVVQSFCILTADWDLLVREARRRNSESIPSNRSSSAV